MSQKPANVLFASPNELVRIQTEQEKQHRLHRIKQVRDQEKQLAASRRTKNQHQTKKEWTEALDKLFMEFQEDKVEKLESLQELQESVFQQKWGQAHKEADVELCEQQKMIHKLQLNTADRHDQELIGSAEASRIV